MGLIVLGFVTIAGVRVAGAAAMEFLRTQRLEAPFHYERPEPVSLLVLVFSVVFVASYGHLFSSKKNGQEMRDYDLLANLSDMAAYGGLNGYLSRRWFRWILRNLASTSPQAELIQVRLALRHSLLKPGLWVGALGLILFTREMLAFQLVTVDAVEVHDPLLFRSARYSWTQLTGVRVGCWVFPRGGLSVEYVATFGSGTELPLLGRRATADDVAISPSEGLMRFAFGRHRGELKMQPDCSDQIRQTYPAELATSLATLM